MKTLFFSIWSGHIITRRIMPFRVLERIGEEMQRGAISDTRYQNGQAQGSGVKYFSHGACQRVRREGFWMK